MNKVIYTLLLVVMGYFAGNAQIRCPYGGTVDCRGECGLFTDDNGDGFCDYGKLSKETVSAEDTATELPTVVATSGKPAANSAGGKPPVALPGEPKEEREPHAKLLEQSEGQKGVTEKAEESARRDALQPQEPARVKAPYHLFELSVGLLLLYIVSVLLTKYRVYTLATHRRIWNVGLTVSFLVSCIIGMLMGYFVNVQSYPDCYRSLVLYHVEFGIAMTVIALFHLVWHWRYYLNLFKSKRGKTDELKKG